MDDNHEVERLNIRLARCVYGDGNIYSGSFWGAPGITWQFTLQKVDKTGTLDLETGTGASAIDAIKDCNKRLFAKCMPKFLEVINPADIFISENFSAMDDGWHVQVTNLRDGITYHGIVKS